MFIDMKQLFEVEGQVIPFTHDLDMSAIELWGTAPFDRPIRLSGRLYNRAGIVFMEYTAQMDYNLMCGRCLERQRRAEVYRFKHVLVRQLNEEDNGDFIVVSGNQLDLDGLATSDILLELPSVVYCREDCKGLCPVCGANLNEKDCGCNLKQPDPRFQILSEFFKES